MEIIKPAKVNNMERKVEESIKKAYVLINQNVPPNTQIDSLEVVKQVEEYRQLWKPYKTNVILLAESHVFTDRQDHEIWCNSSILHAIIPNYPLPFVRFVYCLGYGEDELLTKRRTDGKNTGTPQFWKIFSSCVAENENDLGFHKILKTKTSSLIRRLRNKIEVLQKMREKGIWLLDASIVGLYGSGNKNQAVIKRILEICWKNHIADTIQETNPKHVIIIGKGVDDIISSNLLKLNIPFTVLLQPQARVKRHVQLENYKTYQRICARYCRREAEALDLFKPNIEKTNLNPFGYGDGQTYA